MALARAGCYASQVNDAPSNPSSESTAADASGPSAVQGKTDRPAELLAGAGRAAWQSFNAMQATKQRHFELLEMLDLKRKKYNLEATAEERRMLAHLLADHDDEVKRFAALSAELKASSPDAHRRLFQYIGRVNHALRERRLAH